MPDDEPPKTPVIRVTIQQPAMPHYRVPVFHALSQKPGIELRVVYAGSAALPNATPEGFEARYEPMTFDRLLGRSLIWCRSQLAYATRSKADVLILSWNTRYLSLIPALIKARLTGVKTVLWGHGCSKSETLLRSMLRRLVARLGDAILLYNHGVADQYLSHGYPKQRVYVGLNSLDQADAHRARDAWLKDPDRLEAFRDEHGINQGPYILFVSRLDPANRLDLLVEAIALLAEQHGGLQALIVGKGDEERQRLETLAESLGVADRIRFLGPIYGEEQLAPYFLSSTLFCYPSNMGLSILHAFGYGLPVVCGDNKELMGPEVEALVHGENGLFFTHGDSVSLAQALDQVLSDEAMAQKMSAGATDTIENRFNINAMVDGMEGAIRYCASRR